MFHQRCVLFCSRLIYIEMEGARVRGYAGRYSGYPIAIEFRRKGGSVATSYPLVLSDLSFLLETQRRHYPSARYRYRFKVDAANPATELLHARVLALKRFHSVASVFHNLIEQLFNKPDRNYLFLSLYVVDLCVGEIWQKRSQINKK